MIHLLLRLLIFILGLIACELHAQNNWDLQQCLDYAMKNHPNIQQTALDIENSNQQILAAKGNLLPNLNASANHNYSFGSTINPATNSREALNVLNDQFSIGSNVELFNWKNFLNIQLQKFQKESFQYNVEAQKNALRLQIIQQFFALQNAKAWKNVLETQISGIDEQIRRTEKEVEIGTRAKSDVYDIKANLGNIKESWITAKREEELAKINLLNLLNVKEDSIQFEMNDLESTGFDGQPLNLEEQIAALPSMKMLEKEIELREKEIAMAKADRLPTLNGQYQFSSFYSRILNNDTSTISFGDQLNQNKNHFVGFGLNIPIFNRFQIKTRTALAENAKENAILEKEKRSVEMLSELKRIYASYQNAVEKLAWVESNFQNQELSFARSEEKFNEGLIDAYTFFFVRNNWLNANFNLIQSKNEVRMQEELLGVFLNFQN